GRRRSRRPERPQERDADHCRILPEERLYHLLLRQVASRRRGEVLPDRARLRRDEAVRCVLSGVYGYSDTSNNAHPWFPKGNAEYWKMYQSVVNLYEWEGVAGKPAVKGNNGEVITLENLADFDMRQTDSAIEYIKQHAKGDKPFFMDVNFMKMHQPTSPNKM